MNLVIVLKWQRNSENGSQRFFRMENKVIRIIIVDIPADTVAILGEILFETH